ncbi:MAG: LysM peptidoglycan-binding domain-containing protein, partial [Bacteroidales bacterium]|nr:LysM peptidoglycan-binding domain-containing protein [Bacteroidales bacterium]
MTKRFILIVTMLALLSSPAFSQNYFPEVKISERTTVQNGQTYYVHHVGLRETFYSICKAYNVSVDEIEKANPGGALNRGLKEGMDILIPMKNDPVEKKIEELQIVSAAESGLAHTIKGDVQVQEPAVEKKYRIPEEVEFTDYRVKWIDNIYSIAKKNNISVEAIQYLNDLETPFVKTGQIIKLPKPQYAHYFENLDNLLINEDEIAAEEENEEPEEEIDMVPLAEPFYGTAKVALILPFDANSREPDYNYYDFYSGFLMGVNEIKKQGMNINLNVLDEYNYGLNDTYDFIVGPVFYEDIVDILDFSLENRIPVISPLDPSGETLLPYNPYLIQLPASQATQIKNMVRSINYSFENDNVVVLHEEALVNDDYFNAVIAELEAQGIPYKEFSYGILKGRDISATLINSYIDPTKVNHFIVASE